ncbi:FAD-dependent oxidoreductase [Paenibacillus sp. MBLB4367]|uniref:FAD-dependent oxidoreductase n=1 Tax=Paenibacillus sp. MBLB4367 TaxID=3384767 RepID=UPI00390817C4
MLRNKWFILVLSFVVLLGAGAPVLYYKEKYGGGLVNETPDAQTLKPIKTVSKPKDSYDAVVVGTDPEGVAAAISAARNGLKTLLVDGRDREILGGLMTLGWLNTIDLNQDKEQNYVPGTQVPLLNKGIFQEFYNLIEGTSFDVTTAANAFHKLVGNEPNIDVLLKTKSITPLVNKGTDSDLVEGVAVTTEDGQAYNVKAKSVIDATQDADIAAAAGVPFTIGREDLGDKDTKMAVTVVFRMKHVDANVWQKIRKYLAEDGRPDTDADERSAWGYVDFNSKYEPVNKERVRVRGPNIGRQNDDTALLNMIQIFGIDGADPKSRAEAYELAKSELPNIMAFFKKNYPEFASVEVDLEDLAPELYVRETRHMQGMYRLTMIDVLDNRDQWDRIGFGSYTVDIQRTGPKDNGQEVMKPIKYAIPFRSIVPQRVDGLLVVGRSASYDTLPHGSARVIPTGMAEGEAAGAASKLAIDNKLTFRKLAESKELIAKLQDNLNKQGMDVKAYTLKEKPAYMSHKTYPGLKMAIYFNLAAGRGEKGIDFELDNPANPQRIVNQLNSVKKVVTGKGTNYLKGNPNDALAAIKGDAKTEPLTLTQAAYSITKAIGLNVSADKAVAELQNKKLLTKETIALIADQKKLTYGEVYMILKDMLESFGYRF